jgi:maltose alpha-D-glucosyltransferase/alpha-amylase
VAKGAQRGILYDALSSPRFCAALLDTLARRRRFKGERGELIAFSGKPLRRALGAGSSLDPSPVRREQSNTSVIYGDRLILKMFRRLQEGTNPEVEVGRFLTERTSFRGVAALAGGLEYRPAMGGPSSLAVLRELVPHEGDAWSYTLDQLKQFYEEALARTREEPVIPEGHVLDLATAEIPATVRNLIGSYLASAELLGRRTGELHTALASDAKDPAFAPEPFDPFHRRALYESVRALADRAFTLLDKTLRTLPEEARAVVEQLAARRESVLGELRHILEHPITAKRIRCHGDFHLGQVLYTGKDFIIIDFEGEPARSIGERRLKRSALRDVAGMMRSFDYAATRARRSEHMRPAQMPSLTRWARFWYRWTCVGYLRAYFAATAGTDFLPPSQEERKRLLDFLLLEKALYELGYELDNRPDWIDVPAQGILDMLPEKT